MIQKYKKNNSPTIQNGIFSDFPDVLQTNLSNFPGVLQPDFSCFPDVFWVRHGATCLAFQKKYGRPR